MKMKREHQQNKERMDKLFQERELKTELEAKRKLEELDQFKQEMLLNKQKEDEERELSSAW